MILPQIYPLEILSLEYFFPDGSWQLELDGSYKNIHQNLIQDPSLKDEEKNFRSN